MSEQAITPGARLQAVYDRLQASVPTDRPLVQQARLPGVELRMTTSEAGELAASMTEDTASGPGRRIRKIALFAQQEDGSWSSMSTDTGPEQLERLATLAEQAQWVDIFEQPTNFHDANQS